MLSVQQQRDVDVFFSIVKRPVQSWCTYLTLSSSSLPQIPPPHGLGKALRPTFSPEITSKAVISTGDPLSDQIIDAKFQEKQSYPSVSSGGYTPQEITIQDWPDSTFSSVGTGGQGPSSQGTSAQSSTIYSTVVIECVSADESEEFQQVMPEDRDPHDPPSLNSGQLRGKGGRFSSSPDLNAFESNPAGPLFIRTARDAKGQLILPLLNPQFGSSTDTLSPLSSERGPLLSDLTDCFDGSEWSDSGCDDSAVSSPTQQYCNSHYFPSQRVVPDIHQRCQTTLSSDVIFESGYKENWLPAMALAAASKRQL